MRHNARKFSSFHAGKNSSGDALNCAFEEGVIPSGEPRNPADSAITGTRAGRRGALVKRSNGNRSDKAAQSHRRRPEAGAITALGRAGDRAHPAFADKKRRYSVATVNPVFGLVGREGIEPSTY